MLLDPHPYRTTAWTLAYYYFFSTEMYLIMLMVVVVGPGLISRDLRFNALPLYFSRPLTRSDYFIGKLGVIGTLVAAVAVGPAVLAYLVGICFSFDLSVVKDTYRILLASIAYGIIITLAVGTLMLALSSLSRRSLYVGLMWFGIWWISAAVGGILNGFYMESTRQEIVQQEFQEARAAAQRLNSGDPQQDDPDERRARMARVSKLHQEAFERSMIRTEELMAKAARGNWRSLPSFTANLDRLGHSLLNTDAAWVQVGSAVEQGRKAVQQPMRLFALGRPTPPDQPMNERRLADARVPQYPWWWSASVLAGSMGISAWILSRRVKSLDRLK
jgi:ABC-2 type transport system permease protein